LTNFALFVGTTCVGVVEAKRKNVQGAVDGLADTLEKAGLKVDRLEIPQEVPSLYSVPSELESRRRLQHGAGTPVPSGKPAALKWQ